MIDWRKNVQAWSALRHAAGSSNMMDWCSQIWINLVGIRKLDSPNHFDEQQSLLNSSFLASKLFWWQLRAFVLCVCVFLSIVYRNWAETMSQPYFMNFYIFDNTLCQFLPKSSFKMLYLFMGRGYPVTYSQSSHSKHCEKLFLELHSCTRSTHLSLPFTLFSIQLNWTFFFRGKSTEGKHVLVESTLIPLLQPNTELV